MIRGLSIFIGLVMLAMSLGTPVEVRAQGAPQIAEIIVEGSARVEPATVRSYLLVREGDPFDAQRIDRSLKSLFATGLFADVSIGRDGGALIITVVENPVINRIAFEGNQRIDDEELAAEISLRPRLIYTRTKVQNDVNRLQTLYQREGRFAVTVEPKIIQLPQNRIDLVYEINEGTLTTVQNIRFIGNREFDDGDLRDVIRTVETRWYRFLTSDDTYDPDRMTFDEELLRRFYLENGYADFRMLSAVAEMTPDRQNFFLTFTIEEGERYTFGELSVESNLRDLDVADISDVVDIEQGEWYNSKYVDDASDALTDEAGNMGYAFVDVRQKLNRDRENKSIDIVFEVAEGPRVFVERINITGNSRTLDEVIRREFRLIEGDAFNSSKVSRTMRRLQDLDFFAKVDLSRTQGTAEDKTVLNLDVEEKSTGSLSIGVGYSSDSGPLAEFSIRERNLLGRGQDLKLAFSVSGKKNAVDLSFTEPYFMDREIAAGFDLFRTTQDQQSTSSFSSEQTGMSLRFGYPITEQLHQSWRYTIKQTDIKNVKSTASTFVQAQAGSRLLSEVGHVLLYDKRNSSINPTDGYFVRMNNELAGFGGDVNYLRNRLTGGSYHKIADGWVLGLTGSAAIVTGIGDDVTILDRYFLGGSSLRGFAVSGVGPRDRTSLDALGGELTYTGGIDLSVPLGLPPELGISGKLFTDFGSVSRVRPTSASIYDEGSMRASIGTGLMWISPVGPLSLDYAIPVMKESYDKVQNFRINFGTRF